MRTIEEILTDMEFNQSSYIKQYGALREELTGLQAKTLTPRELHIEEMKAAFKRGEVVEVLYMYRNEWARVTDLENIHNNGYEYRIQPAPDVVIRQHFYTDFSCVCADRHKEPNIEVTFTANGVLKGVRLL